MLMRPYMHPKDSLLRVMFQLLQYHTIMYMRLDMAMAMETVLFLKVNSLHNFNRPLPSFMQ